MMTVELLILSGLLQVETQCITGIPREYGHYLSVHWNDDQPQEKCSYSNHQCPDVRHLSRQ
eukprot:1161574-Pelagomonas_calceolata.AAC.6